MPPKAGNKSAGSESSNEQKAISTELIDNHPKTEDAGLLGLIGYIQTTAEKIDSANLIIDENDISDSAIRDNVASSDDKEVVEKRDTHESIKKAVEELRAELEVKEEELRTAWQETLAASKKEIESGLDPAAAEMAEKEKKTQQDTLKAFVAALKAVPTIEPEMAQWATAVETDYAPMIPSSSSRNRKTRVLSKKKAEWNNRVREWASGENLEIKERGRIPEDIIADYVAEHPNDPQPE